jgi:hypothetical protein
MEKNKIPSELAENKLFLTEFIKLSEKARQLFLILWELSVKTDLTDDDGKKYVRLTNEEAGIGLGCVNTQSFFNELKERGFIENKFRVASRVYLCDIVYPALDDSSLEKQEPPPIPDYGLEKCKKPKEPEIDLNAEYICVYNQEDLDQIPAEYTGTIFVCCSETTMSNPFVIEKDYAGDFSAAFTDCEYINIHGNNRFFVSGRAIVCAYDNTDITATDRIIINSFDNSTVTAFDEVRVFTNNTSNVRSYDNSWVILNERYRKKEPSINLTASVSEVVKPKKRINPLIVAASLLTVGVTALLVGKSKRKMR